MKTNEFVVLEGHDIYIVKKDKIEEEELYSLFDSNGRRFGHQYADDYSVFNKKCGLYSEAIKEGVKKFGEDFERIRFWEENEEIRISNFHELDIEASEQEVADFLLDMESEHSKYKTRKAITWFSGQKWKSMMVGSGLVGPYVMPYDKEDGKEIIEDYLKAMESSGREEQVDYFSIKGDKYKFLEPKWNMFYEAKTERVLVSINPYTLKIKEGA